MSVRGTLTSLLVLAVLSYTSQAQKSPTKYADEPYVVESIVSHLAFNPDGTGSRESEVRVRVQSAAGVQAWGTLPIPYDKSTEEVNIDYVRVVKPDGSVVTTPSSDIQDLDTEVSRVAPMYSDHRQKHVAVKGLSPGDVLEYHTSEKTVKPITPRQFWTDYVFYRDGIVLDEQVVIDVPSETYVKVKSDDVQPVISEQSSRKVYRWTTSNLRHKTDEEKAKQSKREAVKASIQLSTFHSWQEVGKWYADLERDRVQPSAAVREKAAALTTNAKTDNDRARAIYKYVAQDFRYIGLEFGVGRFQPHHAEEVLKNGYGDCKDKHTLLASLLQAAGIKASAALIHSSRKLDEDVPSPAQFDHVISVAQVGDETVWMDTTPEVAPFGLLIWGLRDKKVLVTGDKPEWRKTPANAPMESYLEFRAEGKLGTDGVLEAKITRTMRGDAEVALRAGLRAVGQPEWKELLQRVSHGTGFAGTISDPEVSSPSDTDEPLRTTYNYKRKDYPDWANRRIVGFGPAVPLFAVDEEDKSDDGIILGGPFRFTSHSQIQLPAEYALTLPDNVDLRNDYAEYRAHYDFKDGCLTMDRELKLKGRELPPGRRAEYRKFVKAVSEEESLYIVLQGGAGQTLSDAAAAVGKTLGLPSETAAGLYDRGREQMQARNPEAAMASFKRAAEIDPKFPGVWTAIGFTHLVQGRSDDAIKALQKEIENHPDDPTANKTLAQALFAMRRMDEAAVAMRAYVKVAPEDAEAAIALAANYLVRSKYQDAADVLEAAAKRNAQNALLQTQLGNAYAKMGKGEQAIAALHKAIELQPDNPTALNDAAYYLADANLSLDEAVQLSAKAIKAESALTAQVSLDALDIEDLRRVGRLANFWDTMGWIYFRQNALPKAEEYLRAAWTLSQTATIGEHLAQVYEKEGKKFLAAKTYAQSINTGSSLGVSGGDKFKATKEKVESLVGEGTASGLMSKAGEELSMARSRRVPNFVRNIGSGEFFLLLKPDKTVTVRFVSGEMALKASAASLQAALTGKLSQEQPGAEPVSIVRRAVVICHLTPSYCEIVLLTPDSVNKLD